MLISIFKYNQPKTKIPRSIFLNCYLVAPRPTLRHYWGGSLTHLILVSAFLHIRPEDHREPRNEVGSLSPAKRLVGFDAKTFRFWLQHLKPVDHSLSKYKNTFDLLAFHHTI